MKPALHPVILKTTLSASQVLEGALFHVKSWAASSSASSLTNSTTARPAAGSGGGRPPSAAMRENLEDRVGLDGFNRYGQTAPMPEERNAIHDLRLQLTALLQHSGATPGCKTIAALMAAAYACRTADMPPELAVHMLKSFYRRDPLT
jgi:hypothetical protein